MSWEIIEGDCLDLLRGLTIVHAAPYHHIAYLDLPDNSIDAIVPDPPYGLSFMARDWDHAVPGPAYWTEGLRIAKPGAYLVAFGGTRTYHRLTCAIEDAGWEIRDCLMWLYGSGFPKSHNVAASIDKRAGYPNRGRAIPTASTYQACDVDRENKLTSNTVPAYEPQTDAAKQWDGWGTALAPGWEPIVLARKPFKGTVADNVLKWGTGALNIDGCRIGWQGEADRKAGRPASFPKAHPGFGDAFAIADRSHRDPIAEQPSKGRWP